MDNNRVNYFDVLKMICIFLVIFVHYPWISESKCSNLSMIITRIAVPLFLVINGALLLGKETFDKKNIIKRQFRLY